MATGETRHASPFGDGILPSVRRREDTGGAKGGVPPPRRGALLAAALLAVAALTAGLGAPSAIAAGAGLTYVASSPKPLPAGKQASATAKCPRRASVLGGGLAILGSNTATGIASTFPIDDKDGNAKPEDGWRGVANSRSAGNKELFAVAVCAKSGRYSYVRRDTFLGPDQTYDYAQCPEGDKAVGGGAVVSPGSTIRGLAETGPLIQTPRRATRWYATANNGVPFSIMTVYAVCTSSGSYRYLERVDSTPTPAGIQSGLAAPCPGATKAIAGGGSTGTSSPNAELARSTPYRDGGPGGPPDDGWQTDINNDSAASTTFSTYVVCRR